MNPPTIVIATAGLPELLDVQIRAIRAYVSGRPQILVVDDSRRWPHYSNQGQWNTPSRIEQICELHGAQYCRVPQRVHVYRRLQFPNTHRTWGAGPSLRTADSLQFAWSKLRESPQTLIMILDSDMVPIQRISLEELLNGHSVAYLPQSRSSAKGEVTYPWPGFFIVNTHLSHDWQGMVWDCASANGVSLDTGGALWEWLQVHQATSRRVKGLHSDHWEWRQDAPWLDRSLWPFLEYDARSNGGKQFCELFEGSLLHLRAGSNWMRQEPHKFTQRSELFISSLRELLHATDA